MNLSSELVSLAVIYNNCLNVIFKKKKLLFIVYYYFLSICKCMIIVYHNNQNVKIKIYRTSLLYSLVLIKKKKNPIFNRLLVHLYTAHIRGHWLYVVTIITILLLF